MKSSVHSQTKLIFEILTRGSLPGSKYPTFFGPEFWGHRLRDFHTFCPKYNTKNEDDQNEDDQESLITLKSLKKHNFQNHFFQLFNDVSEKSFFKKYKREQT